MTRHEAFGLSTTVPELGDTVAFEVEVTVD
jgi:hypothetical protein